MILQILTYAHPLKLILSAVSLIASQIASKSRLQREGRQLLQPEAKSSQNQDLVEFGGYFGSDFDGLQLFVHCIDFGLQHRFSHVLVESCRFRMVSEGVLVVVCTEECGKRGCLQKVRNHAKC